MRLTWSEPALANLEAIHDHISRDAPGTASQLVQRIIDAVEHLGDQPRMGRIVPEGDGRQREVIVEPYRVIYREQPHEIYIITVVHGARELGAILERLAN